MKPGGYKWSGLVCLLLGLVVTLGACGQAGSSLPTRAPLAATVALQSLESAAVASGLVPATWTPAPDSTPPAHSAPVMRPLGANSTPTPRPTLPTSTPVPSRTPVPSQTPPPTDYIPLSTILASLPHNPALGPSKLGVHVVRNNSPDIMAFVRLAQPAVMKAVDDLGFLAEVRAASPRTIIVGRINDDFIQNYIGEPEQAAREYFDKHLSRYLSNPAVDYWEGWNEPDPGLDRMIWYSRFEQERVRLMAQYGLRSAIGGFPPGVPEVDEFALFLPAVDVAKQHGGILTLHEGDLHAGDLRSGYGSSLPGYPVYADRGNMTFRYRWFYRELLEPADLVIPLVISELNFVGWGSTNYGDFIAQSAWYDTEVRKDGYVIGFTIFTAGAIEQWVQYDVNPILLDLAAYVNSQR